MVTGVIKGKGKESGKSKDKDKGEDKGNGKDKRPIKMEDVEENSEQDHSRQGLRELLC